MDSSEIILEGFPLHEAETIVQIYACSQCEGGLVAIPSEWDLDTWLVECPDCGNVEIIGRISKTTVAIRHEKGVTEYYRALKALPDLWGGFLDMYYEKHPSLKPGKRSKEQNLKELGF